MWRMQDENRVLTEAEWAYFAAGLDLLRDSVEEDISSSADDAETGVAVFDRLTPEQKLAMLAEVAQALRDPATPAPAHTAANEGAIMAVFTTLRTELEVELDVAGTEEAPSTYIRRLLLAACGDSEDRDEPLPEPNSTDPDEWDLLAEEVEGAVFWDSDFAMGDRFLDLPPEEARTQLRLYGIDPDYYLAVPDEPDERGLTAGRQTLARLLGLPVPDDNGLFPTLEDLFHDLMIGPCSPEEIAAWAGNPWVQVLGSPKPDWDCDYTSWMEKFGNAVPTAPFELPSTHSEGPAEMPSELKVERLGDAWVVRNEQGDYWCGLIENGWTSDPDEYMPALTFPTESAAKFAFVQADRMYAERAARHEQAMAALGYEE